MTKSWQDTLIAVLAMTLAGCGGGDSNHAPTATSTGLSTSENQAVAGMLTASDPDGDTLTLTLETAPSRGTVALSGGLAFLYTPNTEANGTDSFSLIVTDPKGKTATATVSVSIAPVDDPPKIVSTLTLDEDTVATVDLVSDPEGQPVTVNVAGLPAHGTFTVAGSPGRFSYTPAQNYNGTDTVSLTADDLTGHHAAATVTITVRPVNDPPVASADTAILLEGKTLQIDPRLNDKDVDGDPLTTEIVDMPAGWSAVVGTDGKVTVTPPAALVGGPATMTYRVRDPGGLTSTSTVSLSATFTNGVLYKAQAAGGDRNLWYSDGVRSFQVNAPLRSGESLQPQMRVAKSAPVVLYMTTQNTVQHLFRVDLRSPAIAYEIESPTVNPGVGEFAITDDGTRIVYTFDGRYKFIDFALSTAPVDLGPVGNALFLNPAGTRIYFQGLIAPPPFVSWGALFSKPTQNSTPPVQITPTLPAGNSVSNVYALSRDEHRLFYSNSVSGLMVVDPSQLGSDHPLLSNTADPLSFSRLTDDESRFSGWCSQGGQSAYCIGSTQGGATVYLTSGTGTQFIAASVLSSDGSVFAYSRATVVDPAGFAARLYRVDTTTGLPVAIADDLLSSAGPTLGVTSMDLSRDGHALLFSTSEMTTYVGGSLIGGNGRLYVMDPLNPSSRRTIRQSAEWLTVSAISSDGTMGIFLQGSSPPQGMINAVNLLNPSQILPLSLNLSEGALLIPGFTAQGP